jgi:mannan endo-1,4-beta-mannosidase
LCSTWTYPGVSNDAEANQYFFDVAHDAGINHVRLFGHSSDGKKAALQNSPGSYNQEMLKGLDSVIATLAERNMKVTLTFGDNWSEKDSRGAYAEWCGLENPDDFFGSMCAAKNYYKVCGTYSICFLGVHC